MVDRRICVFERADGGVSVNYPNWNKYTLDPNDKDKIFIEDIDTFFQLQMVRGKHGMDDDSVKSAKRVACVHTDLPYRGSFRKAWKFKADDTGIEVDMVEAAKIKTDMIRGERNKKLADLDVEYIRADEGATGADKAKIIEKKQKLRDFPDTVQTELKALKTPKELDDFSPSWPE
jgi:hypothetical protein